MEGLALLQMEACKAGLCQALENAVDARLLLPQTCSSGSFLFTLNLLLQCGFFLGRGHQ